MTAAMETSGLNPSLPVIDLRSAEDYQRGHLTGSTHFPWPTLKERMNELPVRPFQLQLIGEEDALLQASDFLSQKGYDVLECWTVSQLARWLDASPQDAETGNYSRTLWMPSGLVREFVESHQSQCFPQGVDGRKALDIGCGGGRDSVYLARQGWQVTAIDHQQRVLQRAEQLARFSAVPVDFSSCDVNAPGCLPQTSFDLILVVRYLNRHLFAWIKQHLAPGGILIFQTFTAGAESFGSPKNPNFILREQELAKTFEDFEIIIDRIDHIHDGRPVASFIAKKKESKIPC